MKRREFYLIKKPGAGDPQKQRVFVVVSRQALIDSRFSTLTCAPVYSRRDGLSTQVPVGVREGLKKDSSIHCDELLSLPKSVLRNYVGYLGDRRMKELDAALAIRPGSAGTCTGELLTCNSGIGTPVLFALEAVPPLTIRLALLANRLPTPMLADSRGAAKLNSILSAPFFVAHTFSIRSTTRSTAPRVPQQAQDLCRAHSPRR